MGLILMILHESPGSENYPENVIIVMDGMEEFTIEPLKWALENVIVPGRSVLTLVGVVAQKRVVMGHPLRLLAVKHQRKNREFYAKKIPCNMVIMNDEGEADMIGGLPIFSSGENTPVESPASVPTTKVIISMEFDEILKERAHDQYQDKELRGSRKEI
ncbi:hypothetical protein I3760_11G091500 [Carya illinoinensis]|nr:hypothetical protein I3760_11G091500 [Carya illinoinensis]